MESEVSLPFSQKSTTGPYHERHESTPYTHTDLSLTFGSSSSREVRKVTDEGISEF
jgi:hypothetical protein